MAPDALVGELVDQVLNDELTPEEACAHNPELLGAVKERVRQCQGVEDLLEQLFPSEPSCSDSLPPSWPPAITLPQRRLPTIPGYEVLGVLGRGGMGIIYRVRHIKLNRVSALKMLLSGPHASPTELARFMREARAVAALKHQNIVQIYDVCELDGRPYFTMELVEGGTLAQKISCARQDAGCSAEVVLALSKAVHAAHQVGIVHRDLKPGNVLLTVDGVPKISDFGLATRFADEPSITASEARLGTPSYMAPEQINGAERANNPAVDVYALGAILYELLTGRPPFRGATQTETELQILNQDPVPPGRLNAKVSRDLETICLKCLEKDPGKRYGSAADLAEDLERFERHEPILARPTGRLDHFVRWVRRRPAASGLLAAVVMLVSALSIGALVLYQQRAAARARQAQTDHDVRSVIQQAQLKVTAGWLEHDLTKLTQAVTEGDQAKGIAHSGAASAAVQQEARAFRDDASRRLDRAKKNRALMESVLDGSVPVELNSLRQDSMAQLGDEPYTAAFRQWGLDVDGTAEQQVVERLGAEPDVVLQELIAALDDWMIKRRQENRPEVDWRRLFRITNELDRSDRRGQLRALMVDGAPPPPAEWAAEMAGVGWLWSSLWTLEHVMQVRQEVDPATEPPLTIVLLARTCVGAGDPAAGEEVLRQAATAQPGQVVLLVELAKLLDARGASRREEAIGYFRAARALRPHLGVSLSDALCRAGRSIQAEEVLRELVREQPDNYACRLELVYVLAAQGKLAEAVATAHQAIALQPDSPSAYRDLGSILYLQQKYIQAEAAFRKSIALKPNSSAAYNNLSLALDVQGRHTEAEAAARKAVSLEPTFVKAYISLGLALHAQAKYSESEAVFRKAIALRPDYAYAYSNLASALNPQQKHAEAEAAARKAIALEPNSAQAYTQLASALAGQEKNADAEAAIRQALVLNPNSAETEYVLGWVLMLQARFDEAAIALNNAERFLPASDPTGQPLRQLQQQCQRYLALDARLSAILHGTDKAVSAAEQLEFGDLCIRKRQFAAAAHFFADAFAADPRLAEDVPAGTRYNAACVASMAGCGQGQDAAGLDEDARARLRHQALDWFREDLAWWAKKIETGTAPASTATALRHWQSDPDLARVRSADDLAHLPAKERLQWQRFWSDLDALLRRISAAMNG